MKHSRHQFSQNDKQVILSLTGNWRVMDGAIDFEHLLYEWQMLEQKTAELEVDGKGIGIWDSPLLSFLLQLEIYCQEQKTTLRLQNMPDGVEQLMSLAKSVPARQGASKKQSTNFLLTRVGENIQKDFQEAANFFKFIGQSSKSLLRFALGKAQYRKSDFIEIIADTGPGALPIITLISVLVGIILAFVGAVQLEQFGAEIYVADLVAIATVREMGCMMTGIIMAGRTGAAFAARIGTMQVNEEVDALRTFGFSAMDFLVLPRILALVLMMPLLCLYANILGILGGAAISIGAMGLSFTEYWNQTLQAVDLVDISIGLVKAFIFGIVIAITGCMNGIQSGRSASAVGDAATSAVVSGVVFIIVIDGMFAILTSVIGI